MAAKSDQDGKAEKEGRLSADAQVEEDGLEHHGMQHLPSQSLTAKKPCKMMAKEDDPASYWGL